jgi:alpha/beta hydrolase fold
VATEARDEEAVRISGHQLMSMSHVALQASEVLGQPVTMGPVGTGSTWSGSTRIAERCEKGTGGPHALVNLGTRDTARDMDVLRAALGDEKLSYLGYSYGTELGAT